MAQIIVELANKQLIFSSWYQNIGSQWVRVCSTTGGIVIVPALHDYYVATFSGDPYLKEWGNYYHNVYPKALQDIDKTKSKVDHFLIEIVPRLNKLLAFI